MAHLRILVIFLAAYKSTAANEKGNLAAAYKKFPAASQKTGQIKNEKQTILVDPSNTECPCTPSNIWLDVFFLLDSSSAMTPSGFQYFDLSHLDYGICGIGAVSDDNRVGRWATITSWVRFITYGTEAKLLYNLSYWDSTNELMNYMNLSLHGSVGTNIEAAIRLANDNFAPPHHRPNARKVIVIIASAFESGTYSDPIVVANTFKEDGGIIITIEYVQVHGAPVPMLDSMASPGYTLTNRNGKVESANLIQLFCKANCFCPTNYKPFKIKGDIPYGGCYKMSTLPAIQMLAQRSCNRHFNGSLAVVESQDKAEFLLNLMSSNSTFWIGLSNKDQTYRWMDGSIMNDAEFKAWAANYPDSERGDCVKMTICDSCIGNVAWYNERCGVDLLYACQTAACSSDHYCPAIR